MKRPYLFLMTASLLLNIPSNTYALTAAELAAINATISQQHSEIRTFRHPATEIFSTLDSSLDASRAKAHADDIILRPSGLSALNKVADLTFHPAVGLGTPSVRVDVKSYNEGAVRVQVGLLASLGIHVRNIMGEARTGSLSRAEFSALIPGVDFEDYEASGKKVESIWDWVEVETLSLLEKKPAVFKPTAARVKELLTSDRKYAATYLEERYPFKSEAMRERLLNYLIPDFEGEESCPKKGAFISSVFFVQLLSPDVAERSEFIRSLIDTIVPPPGADAFRLPDGSRAEIDLNYYILKAVYKSVVDKRRIAKLGK